MVSGETNYVYLAFQMMLRAKVTLISGTFIMLMTERMMTCIKNAREFGSKVLFINTKLCSTPSQKLRQEIAMSEVHVGAKGIRDFILSNRCSVWCMTSVCFWLKTRKFFLFLHMIASLITAEMLICFLGKSKVCLKHLPYQCVVTDVHLAALRLRRGNQVINCKLLSKCILYTSLVDNVVFDQ